MQRFQFAYGWFPGESDAVALITCDRCAWDYVLKHGDRLPELVRRADEHTEVCR
jgi:hypothetical protein